MLWCRACALVRALGQYALQGSTVYAKFCECQVYSIYNSDFNFIYEFFVQSANKHFGKRRLYLVFFFYNLVELVIRASHQTLQRLHAVLRNAKSQRHDVSYLSNTCLFAAHINAVT